MKDFLDNELKTGDRVVGIVGRMDSTLRFATNSLFVGNIVSFSEKRVRILCNGVKVQRDPNKIVRVS